MLVLVMHKVSDRVERGDPPDPAEIGRVGALVQEMKARGQFLGGEGLGPTSKRVRLTFANGKATVERGPLVGAHEPMSDVALLNVRSMDEAIAWATRVGETIVDGELEIGPLVEPWDLGFCAHPGGEVPLRVMMMHKRGDGAEAASARPLAVAALADEMKERGVLVTALALEPSRKGVRVRMKNERRTVVDGPFAESKELIAGYALIRTETFQEALELSFRFGEIFGEIEMDVRTVAE